MNGGILGSSRAAARLFLTTGGQALGGAGTATVTLNASAFDTAGYANLAGNSLVVPAGAGGIYVAAWGLNYVGGLGQFSKLAVNGTAVAQGSGSTRSVGASVLQLAAGDVVQLQAQVSAAENLGGGSTGVDTWLCLARYL